MNPQVRENRAIFACICAALLLCVAIAFISDRAMGARNVPVYECGKAIDVHDDAPGYRITRKARFIQYEDGSGRLVCGRRTMVIVHVPW